MDLGLADARALVTGGSRGIGAAITKVLVDEGATVAIAARDSDELSRAGHELGARPIPTDLSTQTGPGAAVGSAVQALGGLDILVVSGGGPPAGRFDELSEDAWREAIDGTLWGPIRLLRAALPHLRSSNRAAILLVLSSSVREPVPDLVTSNLIRPGLAGLLKALVPEIAPIRINAVAPGRVATDRVRVLDARRAASAGIEAADVRKRAISRIPLGRYGEPIEVGRVAAVLLSPAASYVTGAIVAVDGGMVRALP